MSYQRMMLCRKYKTRLLNACQKHFPDGDLNPGPLFVLIEGMRPFKKISPQLLAFTTIWPKRIMMIV